VTEWEKLGERAFLLKKKGPLALSQRKLLLDLSKPLPINRFPSEAWGTMGRKTSRCGLKGRIRGRQEKEAAKHAQASAQGMR